MNPSGQHSIALLSIHDVSPRFESEVDRLAEKLTAVVGPRFAMLVVPNHWNDAPIVPGSAFARRLRAWADAGVEIFLHGYFHRGDSASAGIPDRMRGRFMTAGEGEFLGLGREEAVRRIIAGRALLEDVTGRPIAGFVAPAWLYGSGAIEALETCGIGIAEDHWKVWSPQSGRTLAHGPVVTWARRTRMRLKSSLIAAPIVRRLPMRVLRIGLHPPDVHHSDLLRSIDTTIASALTRRRPGTYSELLMQAAPSRP